MRALGWGESVGGTLVTPFESKGVPSRTTRPCYASTYLDQGGQSERPPAWCCPPFELLAKDNSTVSKLYRIKTWYTLEGAARRLSVSLEDDLTLWDVVDLLEEGHLKATFIPESGSAPMHQVVPVCAWPSQGADRWVDQFQASLRAAVGYQQGSFSIEFMATQSAGDLDRLRPEAREEMAVMSGVVWNADWDGAVGAGLIVSDDTGRWFQVLKEKERDEDGVRLFDPLVPAIDDRQIVIHAGQLETLEQLANEEIDAARRWTDAEIDDMAARRARGETLAGIAADYKVSRQFIAKLLKRRQGKEAPLVHAPFGLNRPK